MILEDANELRTGDRVVIKNGEHRDKIGFIAWTYCGEKFPVYLHGKTLLISCRNEDMEKGIGNIHDGETWFEKKKLKRD